MAGIKRSKKILAALMLVVLLIVVDLTTSYLGDTLDRLAGWKTLHYMQMKKKGWSSHWYGVEMQQFPDDLLSYADLIYLLKPDFIIETGTFNGASALYLATVLTHVNPAGKVITVDLYPQNWNRTVSEGKIPKTLKDKIIFIEGSSVADETISQIESIVKGRRAFVILDSYHGRSHVHKELGIYSRFVPVGSYIVVNDTHFELLSWKHWGKAPRSAVKDFLSETDAFVVDSQWPQSPISCAPSGFLKRVKEGL